MSALRDGSRRQHLAVLQLLQAARQTYGLRTGDWTRYHGHATRRVGKLRPRKAAKANPDSENDVELALWLAERAYAEGMRTREELASTANGGAGLARQRHRSQKRLHKAVRHAQHLLKLIEGSGSSEKNNGYTASTLLQAQIYAHTLAGTYSFSLASSNVGPPSAAREGANALATAYVLLESFAQHSDRANDQALAFELIDEIEPMLRFCAYKAEIPLSNLAETARSLGNQQMKEHSEISELVSRYEQEEKASSAASGRKSTKSQQSASLVKQIRWRDVDIPVKSAELSSALAKVHLALSQLNNSSSGVTKSSKKLAKKGGQAGPAKAEIGQLAMARYDRALSTLSEAEQRARKLVEDNATALGKAHSTRFESATKPLATAHSYILFQLLSLRISRDENLLASSLAKLKHREQKATTAQATRASRSANATRASEDTVARRRAKTLPVLVKLLDTILQSLEQIRELDIVEEDSADLASQVDAKIAFLKARRCLYLAQVYALVGKYPESLSLSQRASLYIRQLRSSPLTPEELADPGQVQASEQAEDQSFHLGVAALAMPSSSIGELEKELSTAEDRSKKDWYLFRLAEEENAKSDQAETAAVAIDGLSLAHAGRPKVQAKKAGPLFFDVAFNYIASVDLELLDAAAKGEDVEPISQVPAAADSPSVVEQAKDVVMETAQKAQEAVQDAVSGSAPGTPSKSGGSGIWGFFGRGKK